MAAQPLISFVIVFYNQAPYAREAALSALAQTYEPLEIIFSDDCSSDDTFEILEAEVAAYDGPHKVTLRRNPVNGGLAENINAAFALTKGEFIVVQGGDDVSAPERVTKLVQAAYEPTPVDMVCSDVILIDEKGQPLPQQRTDPAMVPLELAEAIRTDVVYALGCACAYSRTVWAKYGPLDSRVLQEDAVLPFRALLERGVRIVPEPLVKYRIHGANLWGNHAYAESREKRRRRAYNRVARAHDWARSFSLSGRTDPGAEKLLRQRCRLWELDAQGYERSRAGAVALVASAIGQGVPLVRVAGLAKRHILRLDK